MKTEKYLPGIDIEVNKKYYNRTYFAFFIILLLLNLGFTLVCQNLNIDILKIFDFEAVIFSQSIFTIAIFLLRSKSLSQSIYLSTDAVIITNLSGTREFVVEKYDNLKIEQKKKKGYCNKYFVW